MTTDAMRIDAANLVLLAALVLLGWSRAEREERQSQVWKGERMCVDLDVAIPPGSPTTWAGRFPAIRPGPPRFPLPQAPTAPAATTTAALHVETDVDYASPFGVVGILTWDIAGHLRWVGAPATAPAGPVTGVAANEAPPPRPNDALHWAVTGAMLRLLLHPQVVSEPELVAHLLEIGEPALAVLDAARAESALAGVCDTLAARIPAPRFGIPPIPGTTPRETMLSRFLVRELVAAHPYDPEGTFGRRVCLFADELTPLIAKYTRHHDPFVRRNAVAALTRIASPPTGETLTRVASDTDDPVMMMRALAALGERRWTPAARPLLTRLAATDDRIEQVALIEALGRIGDPSALPVLLEIGNAAYPDDPHLLQAVLAALVRMPADDAEVTKFVERVGTAARRSPELFDVLPDDDDRPRADRPDGRDGRGRLLGQLTLLWHCHTGRADARARADLLAMLDTESATAGVGWSALGPTNARLARISPPVRFLFLETLHLLGDEGLAALETVVNDADVEPALRAHALGWLTPTRRTEASIAMLGSGAAGPEMRAHALDLLVAVGDPRVIERCREVLRGIAGATGEKLTPAQRYLAMRALQVLRSNDAVRADDALPLLELLTSPMVGGEAARERVRELVRQLVAAVADRARPAERRASIDRILDVVVSKSLHPGIDERTRSATRQRVEDHLAGLRRHRRDARYQQLVVAEILKELLDSGSAVSLDPTHGDFVPTVPLEEEILFALGRTGSKAAVDAMSAFVAEHTDSPHRAAACLALGMTGDASAASVLVRALLAADPFTRFCAYEALRRLSGEDHWCDWMYGATTTRTVAAEKYHRWAQRK